MTEPRHPFITFIVDLWFHLKGVLCIIRRRHQGMEPIGEMKKKGFRGVALFQCRWCASIWIRPSDAPRVGGRRL